MKRLILIALAAAFLFVSLTFTACDAAGNDAETVGTDDVTNGVDTADHGEYLPDFYPYNGNIIPASVSQYNWGAPDGRSVYFYIDEDHVIHDGKGTYMNMTDRLPTHVFDMDTGTFYDCDEGENYPNIAEMEVGIPYDGDVPFETGYVGAYIEGGAYITAIRWFGRAGDGANRNAGGKFQASVDGEEWVDLCMVTTNSSCHDFEKLYPKTFPEECATTAYRYIRYVSPQDGFCNIAEIEIWGIPAGLSD